MVNQQNKKHSSSDDVQSSSALHPISCNRCRSRHTKCDKILPTCSYCMENNLECIYETPKKVRKNYLAEFVDLNEKPSLLVNLNANPQSKYKVFKFSVGDKKKKRRANRKTHETSACENVGVEHDKQVLETLDTVQIEEVAQHHDVHQQHVVPPTLEKTFLHGLVTHLEEKLMLKSFRTDAYKYYTQFIAFGTLILTEKTIERVYEFVDDEQMMTQLYPEDVLSLIYAIHAVNLYVFEQRDVSFRSFEKSLRLLQYDPASIGNLILCLDVAVSGAENSTIICLSSDESSSEVYISNNRDHNSLFLISSRLMLSQYCLCLGLIPAAAHFLHEADVMLKNRFPVYRDQAYLPSRMLGMMVDPVTSLYQGLTQDEIYVLKYRLICGLKLDDSRFFQEKFTQYTGYSTPQVFENYTRTSSALSDDPKYLFSSYVNKYILGTILFVMGIGKKDLLKLVQMPNVTLKNQPNTVFMIIGILDFNGNILKKLTMNRYNLSEEEVDNLKSTEVRHRYQDLVFVFQKIFMTSYSFLVLHEAVINYSSPFTLMNPNRSDEFDIDSVKNYLNFRNNFADELSDLYGILPDYSIHFISLVMITVFLVAKIHYDKLLESGNNPDQKLLTRMKNDLRMLKILLKKFPKIFTHPHLYSMYSTIEYQVNRFSN